MKVTNPQPDFRPPERPNAMLLRDALQKGLGRALLWARQGKLTERTILLEACLHDLRYDRQCEDARGPWLWRIMEAAGVIDEFRERLFEGLRLIDDGLAGQQLCQFCTFYAREGDDRFRRQLQEIVARKPIADCPWLGEEELIELDAEAGFLFAVRARCESLLNRECECDDLSMIDVAIEKLGKEVVVTLLDQEAQTSAAMNRLRDAWRTSVQPKAADSRQRHADGMRRLSLQDIIHTAEVNRKQAGLLRGWGMYAEEADLRKILDRLFKCQKPDTIVSYLRIFSNRPMPEFDARILGLLDHEDETVRSRAFTAVAQNTHPAIRKFAVDHVQERIVEPNVVELFIRNFLPGDEEVLLKNIRIPEDTDQCHSLLMDVTNILEHNLEARCEELATLAYRLTPCGSCRFDSAKLLITRKVASAWLIQECRYDAVPDTRELVAEFPVEA
jgi:hypothetical protein